MPNSNRRETWTPGLRPTDRILLTGVTGLLAGTVASKLLRHDYWRQVLVLVRSATPAEGRRRVIDSLHRFGLSQNLSAQITEDQILCGGLGDFRSLQKDSRLKTITHVLNSAGVTSFAHHPHMWQTNVDDTISFAKAVGRLPSLKRFMHLGTAMICGTNSKPIVQENDSPSAKTKHLVEYTETKAEAERRLIKTLKGVPFVIARPSIVVGHTRLGCKPSGSIFWTLRVAEQVGGVTGNVDARIDLIPADYAARAILHLLFASTLRHKVYHISAGPAASTTFRQIGRAFAKARGATKTPDFRALTYTQLAAMKDRFPAMFGECNVRFMLKAIKLYGHFAALNVTFDNQRLLDAGFEKPPRFTDYLDICVQTSEGVSIADQLLYDFQGSGVPSEASV